MAHLSDPHLTTGALGAGPAAGLALALARAATFEPDLVVVTGDLVERGERAEYEELRQVLRRHPAPVVVTTGNHDRRDPMLAVLGGEARHVVERDEGRLVVLDSLVEDGSPRGAGRLGGEQVRWLHARLGERPDVPTLLALHHPPIRTGIAFLDGMNLLDAADLAAVVERHPQVRAVLAGHVHRHVTGTLGRAVVSVAPSTFRQSALDLTTSRPPGYLDEPTGFLLHRLTATEHVVHAVAVSHAGARLAW